MYAVPVSCILTLLSFWTFSVILSVLQLSYITVYNKFVVSENWARSSLISHPRYYCLLVMLIWLPSLPGRAIPPQPGAGGITSTRYRYGVTQPIISIKVQVFVALPCWGLSASHCSKMRRMKQTSYMYSSRLICFSAVFLIKDSWNGYAIKMHQY